MKHNLLKSVILSVILLMGVSNAWAYDVKSPHVYFNATNVSSWPGVNIVVGHDSYSFGDLMSKVSNTNLYYAQVTFNGTDANGFVFIGANSKWGEYKNQSLYNRTQSQSNRTDYLWFYNTITDGLPSGTYYFSTSGNKQAIDYSQYTTIPTFNTTSAVRVRTGTSGTYSNASGTYPANISIQGTYISGDGKTNRTSITSTKSSDEDNKKVYGSVITGLVTLSYSNLNEAYTFDGWGTSNSKVSSTSTNYEFNQSANTTVYAFFTKKTYTITYKQGANGSGSIDAGIKEHGVNYTLSSNKFTRTGYTQTGWSTSDGGAKVYDLGGTYTANTDVTLYPFWTLAEYTITYDNLKDATHTNPATYTINSATITFTAPTSKPAGYTFANWSPASIATGSTGNKTVTANWTAATSTVELNQEEATEKGTASVTATYGSAMPAITKLPIRTGYTFGGYYTGKDGAGTQYYKADGTSATTWDLEGAQTLYAKWTANTYQVKFNGNGNTGGSMSNQSFTYDEEPRALTTNAFTRTGYTFAGWNTASNGTGTAYTNGQEVKNLTANNNSTYNIYAQWIINQYTLTYSAGEGGSVTGTHESGAKLDYNTSVTLTATPEGENAFAQWVDENGVKVSTTNPYTFTLTGDKTLKAEFSKPTTVYLKPSDDWKANNAYFAIYAWGGKSGDPWVDMEAVDCEGEYYKANVPAGFSDFAFVRLKEGGEHDWANKLNQTGNLTVQTNSKNMYDIEDKTMTYIHLEAKAWDNGDARFAAYFFGNGDKWVNLTKNGDVYSCKKPEGYTSVIFCRMNKNNADNNFNNCWNKTKDLSLMDNGDNCFWIDTDNSWGCAGDVPGDEANDGDGDRDGADGGWYRLLDDSQWKAYSTPTYDVTIKPTIHGTYSVVCNGRAYPVTYKKDVVIPDVPMGTVLTIQDVKPSKETEYTSNIIYKESTNATYQTVTDNQIIVCGNTTIDENFVTTNEHVVYLRIPSGLSWKDDDHQYLYSYNKLESKTTKLTAESTPNGYETGYTYYTCTIPAGTHTIRFEYHSGGATVYQTHDFPHVMPLGSLNCYTIQAIESDKVFNGYWSELLSNGDYRLLYVEQVVEKDQNNKTVITRKKAHPSNIIKKRTETGTDIVSLHVYNQNTYEATYKWENESTPLNYTSPSNSAVILQQYDGSKWVDIQHHMVFGPLEAHVYTAMLPGRRNATAEDEPLVAQLKADYGIKAIINDTHEDKGNGVWNFPIKQTVDGGNTTVELMRKDVHRYTGEYYIRTDVANGGWFNYNPTNHMTRSDEAKANSNFSHYYCKWVVSNNDVNVKFTVANDYGYAISDTLEADRTDLWGVALAAGEKMVTDQKLPTDANVRFAWNEYSNFVHRAYIAGSANVSDRFLVLEGDANIFDANGNSLAAGVDNGTDPRYGLNANEEIFRDNSNWIYYADVQMKPMAPVKVTAKYNGKTQYFIGKQNETVTLLQGSGEEKYLIRMLYDFKTNQLISAYVPGASDKVNAISTNLMLIRQNNEVATQLIFNTADPHDMETIPADRRAYGVIEFTEKRLIQGKDDEDKSLNDYEKSLYWISFPFDVDVSKAISFGEYGKHWIIQEYNGERRAKEGMWLDSETFWDYQWDQNITLKAGKGYVLALDVDQIASDNLFSLAGNRPIGIYFPSTEYINTAITEQRYVSTTVPAWECTINRGTPKGDRRIADSHWNVIGVPSYVNAKGDYSFADIKIETKPTEVKYYYRWLGDFNKYQAEETTNTQNFQSTYAYMVQFAGQINWQNIFNVNGVPKELAAKQSTDSEQEHRLRLELHQNGNKADHTFVRLQDEDGVTYHFDFNHDLCKVINAGANIYSIITAEESPVEVAANVMPIAETIIPVGVKITAAGEYTFRMPDGTDGIVVELIDYENNTRTNMLLDNYTVNLEKGTFDNRFALHIKPNKTATGVDNIGNETTGDKTGLRKFIIDGILYMQKDGVLYDAQGKLVR